MPTITIKQVDNTSAAALRQLKNVFLIGPKGTPSTDTGIEVAPDSNKVYYFTSSANFMRTIGVCKDTPDYEYVSGDKTYKCKSYGNQMAAELLALGYGVYYYCIENQTDFTTIVTGINNWTWDWLADTSLYPIDYIATGFVGAACYSLITALQKIVEDRSGDCLLLVDIPTDNEYLQSVKDGGAAMAGGTNVPIDGNSTLLEKLAAETYKLVLDKNCAPFAPVCEISGLSVTGYTNSILPASFYYLACAINVEENLGYKEWFAVAGLTRGRRGDRIATPEKTFGDRDATACAPRSTDADSNSYKFNYAINLVARQAGGFYIWGNRTGKLFDAEGLVAEHFLNIQRLCISLKKQIYSTCKKLTFDPNSDILWSNFVGGIEPLLKDMQANQGINGYKIIRVKSDVKAKMKAKIRIVPIEAVEDFEIELTLEDLIEA